jgi:hypothetical protein
VAAVTLLLPVATTGTAQASTAHHAVTAVSTKTKRLPPPTGVYIQFKAHLVHIGWKPVKGAKKYVYTIWRQDILGPPTPHFTTNHAVDIPYSSIPNPDTKTSHPHTAWHFSVAANGAALLTSVAVAPRAPVPHTVVKTDPKHKKAWYKRLAKYMGNCQHKAGIMAVQTGIAGGSAVVVSAFVPELEVVTVPGVAGAAVAAGLGSDVACLARVG